MTSIRRSAAEFVGTALLVTAVVGSGIMAERLSPNGGGLALLANSLATGGALLAVISAFGPVSGAHLNPVVTVACAVDRGFAWGEVPGYLAAQFSGGLLGVSLANVMFAEPIALSTHARTGGSLWLGEVVATFGLLSVVWGCSRSRSEHSAVAIAAYIVGAYWFTSSTSFANPAVTVARAFTNTFTGIRLLDVPAFILAQSIGGALATAAFHWLMPARTEQRDHSVAPVDRL